MGPRGKRSVGAPEHGAPSDGGHEVQWKRRHKRRKRMRPAQRGRQSGGSMGFKDSLGAYGQYAKPK